jgi:uncharacterized membrane protein YfcA
VDPRGPDGGLGKACVVSEIAALTPALVLLLAIAVSFLGSLGGLGGVVLLVPILVLLG